RKLPRLDDVARADRGTGVSEGRQTQSGTRRIEIRSHSRAVRANGHLVYVRNHQLVARPFDARSLELTGGELPLAESFGVGGPEPRLSGFRSRYRSLLHLYLWNFSRETVCTVSRRNQAV